MRLGRVACWAICVFALWSPTEGLTQGNLATPSGELEETYQLVLRNPSNQALNRRLIQLAIELRDYDTAIGAVERLIFYQPNDPALQLEAARLYLLIKSYAAAAGYLQAVSQFGRASPDQLAEAAALLADIDKKTQTLPFSGLVQSGIRFQSNANIGSKEIGINDNFPFEKPQQDWNTFVLGTVGASSQLTKNLAIEGTLSGYYGDQWKVNRLDLGFVEATFGPRLSNDSRSLSLKPYVIGQAVTLAGRPYQRSAGAGAQLRWTFAEGWYIEPGAEYKHRLYINSGAYPAAADQTGDLYTYAVSARGQFSDRISWSSRVAYAENDAAKGYQSYYQYLANLALLFQFDFLGSENWAFSPYAKVLYSDYRGVAPPEELAGPPFDIIRRDFQWSIGASLEIPLVDELKLGVQVEYTSNDSNLDRYVYQNLQIVTGPIARF